jgi:hypothetical protein
MNFSILDNLEHLTPVKGSKTKHYCPVCDGNDLDISKDGKYQCFSGGCDTKAIASAILTIAGSPPKNPKKIEKQWTKVGGLIEILYPARDEGALAKVIRQNKVDRDGNPDKDFYQKIYSNGDWVNPKEAPDLKKQIPIYRYSEVREAIAQGQQIFVVEGEKTADAFWAVGIPATTTIGGSGGYRNYGDYSEDLTGARLVLCPDRDPVGLKYMGQIASDFAGQIEGYYLAGEIEGWSNPRDKRDVADDLRDRHLSKDAILQSIISVEQFKAITAKAVEQQTESEDDEEPTAEEIDLRIAQQREDFPLSELFPAKIAEPLAVFCDRTGVPQGALGMFVITCLATLVNPKTSLDCGGGTGNKARPIFWVANYGVSGSGKSHGWKPPMDILREFAREANGVYIGEKESWESATRAVERAKKKKADLAALDDEVKELADKAPPDRPRFKMDSFSIEALLKRQGKQQDRGLLAFSDELVGWVERMDPAKGEESLWLSLWLGDDLDGERIGREVEYIERSAISVMGGIQPDVFRKLVRGNEESQNGFLQRVILVRMHEQPRPPMVDEEEPDYSSLRDIFRRFRTYTDEVELKLGVGGFSFAQRLRSYIDDRRLKESRKTIKAIWPKFEAYCFRIALVLHLIEHSDPDRPVPTSLPLTTLERAWSFTQWLIGQAIQIYEEQLESDRVDVRIGEFLEAARYKDWMGIRDIQRLRRRWFKDSKEVVTFMNRLVELRYVEQGTSAKGKQLFRVSIQPKSGDTATKMRQVRTPKELGRSPSSGDAGDKTEKTEPEVTDSQGLQDSKSVAGGAATKMNPLAMDSGNGDHLKNVAGIAATKPATKPEGQNDEITPLQEDRISEVSPVSPSPGDDLNLYRESDTDKNVAVSPLFGEVEVKNGAANNPIGTEEALEDMSNDF